MVSYIPGGAWNFSTSQVNSSPACDYSTPVTCPLVQLLACKGHRKDAEQNEF